MIPIVFGAIALGGVGVMAAFGVMPPGETSPLAGDTAPPIADAANIDGAAPIVDGDGVSPALDYSNPNNVDAFLAVIRMGESSNNYGALVGGGTFTDFSHHPATGRDPWKGIVTAAGPSHAAGAYQFQPGTWLEAAAACNLTNFEPASQDTAAVWDIKRRGAYDAIMTGDIAGALLNLRQEWAMFTDAKWSEQNVASAFTSNGGILA